MHSRWTNTWSFLLPFFPAIVFCASLFLFFDACGENFTSRFHTKKSSTIQDFSSLFMFLVSNFIFPFWSKTKNNSRWSLVWYFMFFRVRENGWPCFFRHRSRTGGKKVENERLFWFDLRHWASRCIYHSREKKNSKHINFLWSPAVANWFVT